MFELDLKERDAFLVGELEDERYTAVAHAGVCEVDEFIPPVTRLLPNA